MTHLLIILLCTLPRIELTYTTLATDTFNEGTFCFMHEDDTIALNMQVRHRGASSLYYEKPSFAVKLCDSLGHSVDTALMDMRKDNYWILDAMASDKARMRNRVSMDLWLEFSRKPWYYEQEPKMINGYRGHMVEVYVNHKAYGIYHLMERVDRKQLKLKKFSEKNGIRGVLYKNCLYSLLSRYWIDSRNPMPDSSDVWNGFEQKYPDMEDGEPMYWIPLHHHVTTCLRTNKTYYPDSIRAHLDIPVFVDYVLFCQLLSARDNVGKNLYLSLYSNTDERMLYTPWDLDHSWGRMYNSQPEAKDAKVKFGDIYLYNRMSDYYHLQDTLTQRYAQLRQHYFTIDHIDSLFAPYFDYYACTGADTLEQGIWSGHNEIVFDIAEEQSYIHDWVEARLEYLDALYNYQPPIPPMPTAIESTSIMQHPAMILWHDQQMYILKGDKLYNLYGRIINAPSWIINPR